MGYRTRVFCKSKNVPKVSELMTFLNSNLDGVRTNLTNEELGSKNWKDFELSYQEDKLPILIEVNKVGDQNKLAEEELQEFKEFIGKPKFFESKKRKAINHLRRTNYIICTQLPNSDINDKGYNVNGYVLEFFHRNYDGLIQADGEGIYIDEKYLIKIE